LLTGTQPFATKVKNKRYQLERGPGMGNRATLLMPQKRP
jgi:hypothetical protein